MRKHTTSKALEVDIPKQILPFQDKIDHIVPHQTIVLELWYWIDIDFARTSNEKLFSINEEVQREALKGFYDR